MADIVGGEPGGKCRDDNARAGSSLTPSGMFLIAVWFGLVAGLAELALLVLRVELIGNGFFLRSRHFLWMVPLSDLLIDGGVGTGAGVVAADRLAKE